MMRTNGLLKCICIGSVLVKKFEQINKMLILLLKHVIGRNVNGGTV